ncbi:MAG: hyalin [Alcanivorax nanhaiticus]
MMKKQVTKLAGAVGLAAMITACGGGGSSSAVGTTVSDSGNGFVVFAAYDGAAVVARSATSRATIGGMELWKTNGSSAGTVKITDANGTGFTVAGYYMAEMNGKIYYPGEDASGEVELWVTDGTGEGTQRVKDIDQAGSSWPRDMVASEGKLYVNVFTSAAGRELLVTDGSEAGTELFDLEPLGASTNPVALTPVSGGLFFYDQNDGEVYFSDGTLAGTGIVAQENQSIASGSLAKYPELIIDDEWLGYQGKLLFTGRYNASDAEIRLYELDQNGNIREISFDDGGNTVRLNITENVVTSNGKVYFVANSSVGLHIFEYDGSTVSNLTSSEGSRPYHSSLVGTSLGVFMYVEMTGLPPYLLRVDNTNGAAGVGPALRGSGDYSFADVEGMVEVDGAIFFSARTEGAGGSDFGIELWKTDGTQQGTDLVKDINDTMAGADSYPYPLTFMYQMPPTVKRGLGRKYLFVANNGSEGFEPWVSDGSEAGTILLKDISAGSGDSIID